MVPEGSTLYLVTQQQARSQLIQYPAPHMALFPAWFLCMVFGQNLRKISKSVDRHYRGQLRKQTVPKEIQFPFLFIDEQSHWPGKMGETAVRESAISVLLGLSKQISCFGFTVVWDLWGSLWDHHSKQARSSEWISAGINDSSLIFSTYLVLLNT